MEGTELNTHYRPIWLLGIVVAIAGCGTGGVASSAPAATTSSVPATTSPDSSPGAQDIMQLGYFAALEPGIYFIDPDGLPSTPLRVLYTIPSDGWSSWIGAIKEAPGGGRVGISITTVTNLVADGCQGHWPADPPVGPTVDDLATALSELAPFLVAEPPTEVTVYGYDGKHLALTVPDLPFRTEDGEWTKCLGSDVIGGELRSWISPNLSFAFYGYDGPGEVEEFLILDVDGIRLVIIAGWTPDAPEELIAEMRVVLDSIQIEP